MACRVAKVPMGHVLNTFGMARTITAATLWGVLHMIGMGRPMAAAALWGVCLIRLAWAALWLRPHYGACA